MYMYIIGIPCWLLTYMISVPCWISHCGFSKYLCTPKADSPQLPNSRPNGRPFLRPLAKTEPL